MTKIVPLCRFLFVYFGEIVHVHRCVKFEVCSYTRFRDTSEGLPNFIGARDPIKATPRYRILFVPFGEIVHMHPPAKFQVCSFARFGDMFEGVQNFIGVT